MVRKPKAIHLSSIDIRIPPILAIQCLHHNSQHLLRHRPPHTKALIYRISGLLATLDRIGLPVLCRRSRLLEATTLRLMSLSLWILLVVYHQFALLLWIADRHFHHQLAMIHTLPFVPLQQIMADHLLVATIIHLNFPQALVPLQLSQVWGLWTLSLWLAAPIPREPSAKFRQNHKANSRGVPLALPYNPGLMTERNDGNVYSFTSLLQQISH